jgi:hypothetical protein
MLETLFDDCSAYDFAIALIDDDARVRAGVPDADWTREDLSRRAVWENNQIGQSRYCSPNYWCLGKILLLIQADIKHGHWEAWCEEHKIQPDRWKCGRVLALAFSSPDKVARLPVKAAEAAARELLGPPPRQSTADTKLRRWVTALEESLQNRLDELPEVTRPDGLRPRLGEIRRKLTALDHALVGLEKRTASRAAKPRRDKRPK